jgi:tetratricopeptide (TPR) repeat protein
MEALTEKQKRKLVKKVWNNLNAGQPQKSAEILKEAVQKYPNDEWLSLFYCEINSMIGNDKEAIKKLNKILKKQPDFSEAWALLAEIYYRIKKYEKAKKAYEKALALNPYETNWLDSLIYLYFQSRNVKNAHRVLKNALKDNPKDNWVKLLLAMTYLFDDKPQKAFLSVKSVIDECSEIILPRTCIGIYALNLAGACKMETEEYEDAINFFKEAIKINQNSYFNLAQAYYNLKNYRKAVKYCKIALEIEPNDNNYWELLGKIYMETNDWNKAAKAFRKAIDLGNDKFGSKICLCLTLYYTGKYQEALERCNALLATNQSDKNVLYLCACIYNKLNQPEKALDYLERALYCGFPTNQIDMNEFYELEDNPRFKLLVKPQHN